MPSIKALPVIVQKLWPRLKFLWQTDRQTDGLTDGRMRFNVPALLRKWGTIITLLSVVLPSLQSSPLSVYVVSVWAEDWWWGGGSEGGRGVVIGGGIRVVDIQPYRLLSCQPSSPLHCQCVLYLSGLGIGDGGGRGGREGGGGREVVMGGGSGMWISSLTVCCPASPPVLSTVSVCCICLSGFGIVICRGALNPKFPLG